MYISVLEYDIQGVDDEGWSRTCDQLAPAFAAVPGLLSKIWLHGEGNRRGGVYVWDDEPAFEGFLASDLGRAVRSHPSIADLTMRVYTVDEAPTRVTFATTHSASTP